MVDVVLQIFTLTPILERLLGFRSVSHDLIFGLPHQTLDTVLQTIDKTSELVPDRIAYGG